MTRFFFLKPPFVLFPFLFYFIFKTNSDLPSLLERKERSFKFSQGARLKAFTVRKNVRHADTVSDIKLFVF